MNDLYPQLHIYLDGAEEPQTVHATSADFWAYEELVEKSRTKSTETGMRLTIAYIAVHGTEPVNLGVVKEWAREHRVLVTLGDPVRPTPSAATADS